MKTSNVPPFSTHLLQRDKSRRAERGEYFTGTENMLLSTFDYLSVVRTMDIRLCMSYRSNAPFLHPFRLKFIFFYYGWCGRIGCWLESVFCTICRAIFLMDPFFCSKCFDNGRIIYHLCMKKKRLSKGFTPCSLFFGKSECGSILLFTSDKPVWGKNGEEWGKTLPVVIVERASKIWSYEKLNYFLCHLYTNF